MIANWFADAINLTIGTMTYLNNQKMNLQNKGKFGKKLKPKKLGRTEFYSNLEVHKLFRANWPKIPYQLNFRHHHLYID